MGQMPGCQNTTGETPRSRSPVSNKLLKLRAGEIWLARLRRALAGDIPLSTQSQAGHWPGCWATRKRALWRHIANPVNSEVVQIHIPGRSEMNGVTESAHVGC